MSARKDAIVSKLKQTLPVMAVLAVVLIYLFRPSFQEGMVMFSNDGPLGRVAAHAVYDETAFAGYWMDLYWLGQEMPSAPFNVTLAIYHIIGPPVFGLDGAVNFLKFYGPLSLALLGFSAWLFCRQLRFHPAVCILVGVASALNSNALSNVAWGLPSFAITRAMCFFAMAAVVSPGIRKGWIRLALAGFAVGVGVSEGFDTGAIFSLYLAAFALVWFGFKSSEPALRGWGLAGGRVIVLALFAAMISAHTLVTLVNTQIIGTASAEIPANETPEAREAREQANWLGKTTGSLPKLETLRVVVPGLFGYRMSPDEEQIKFYPRSYWGRVNESPTITDLRTQSKSGPDRATREQAAATLERFAQSGSNGFRFSGSGEYAGLLVALMALWAFLQSLRPNGASSYSAFDRRMIWFWTAIAVLSLMACWGRFFPLYSLIYKLPYFSTIRNPIKFTQPMHMALIVLFAYGLQDLYRRYVIGGEGGKASAGARLKAWWKASPAFDRRWLIGCGAAVASSVLCLIFYITAEDELLKSMATSGFAPEQAKLLADHSFGEAGKFVFMLLFTAGLVAFVMRGVFRGSRARWAGPALGALLVLDLGGAARPWIVHENYKDRYANNAVIDTLKQEPHLNRVAFAKTGTSDQAANARLQGFHGFHHMHWLQNQFPYNRVQTLDIHQDPRPTARKQTFEAAMAQNPVRHWVLSNNRYLIGVTPQAADLNMRGDPIHRRFRVVTSFHLTQPAGERFPIVHVAADGPYALMEFGGALPRARLFSNWLAVAEDEKALGLLVDPAFEPARTLLVAGDAEISHTGSTNFVPGTVEHTHYTPKRRTMKVNATEDAILLLNDQHHPDWKVTVDGHPAELLRCNYVMRGVRVGPGEHVVDFQFRPASNGFYMSLLATFLCVGLLGYLSFFAPIEREESGNKETPDPKNREDSQAGESVESKTSAQDSDGEKSDLQKRSSNSRKRRR